MRLIVRSRVLEEVEAVLRRKASGLVSEIALLMDRCRIRVTGAADPDAIAHCTGVIGHAGDGPYPGGRLCGEARLLSRSTESICSDPNSGPSR